MRRSNALLQATIQGQPSSIFHLHHSRKRREKESRESGVGGFYGLGQEMTIITLTTCHFLTLNIHGHSSQQEEAGHVAAVVLVSI